MRIGFQGLISSLQQETDKKMHSVIVKVRNGQFSIGHMSRGGAFKGGYDTFAESRTYAEGNLIPYLMEALREYKELNPRKGTLYFRYNEKKDLIQVFNSSSLTISGEVISLP